jgi:hypothetical protein
MTSLCFRAPLAVLAVVLVSACGSPTDPPPALLGSARIELLGLPDGTRTYDPGEAAFYVYNLGPGPDDRAMYLTVSGRGPRAVDINFFQSLDKNAEVPRVGTYRAQYGSIVGDPTMGGEVLFPLDGKLSQMFPVADSSTVTLTAVTHDRVYGTLSLIARQHPPGDTLTVRVEATFEAERVPYFESLPRPMTRP